MEKIIQISAGLAPLECQWVVAKVLKIFLQEAKEAGIGTELIAREEGDANLTVKSATLRLRGKDLSGFLQSWLGDKTAATVCWVGKSTFRKLHPRSNWYIGIFVLEDVEPIAFNERDVQYQAVRAQGAGGGNVNKVSSAVRATHTPTGIAVFAQDSRSQLENKKLATQRLKERVAQVETERIAALSQRLWGNHTEVERGNPIRTFTGTDFKPSYKDKSFKKERRRGKQELRALRSYDDSE